jgi:FkbM family methyltransferase
MANGVVHVGSHKGEEVPRYVKEGRWPIICFEPQGFLEHYQASVYVVQAALSDHGGWMVMRIPHHAHETTDRDTQSASGLLVIPERAKEIGWVPAPAFDLIQAPVIRFDDWAKENYFEWGGCSLLVVDVQGMEMRVLEGMGEYLEGFTEVIVECSERPIYLGGEPASAIADLMRSKGFEQTTPIVAHGDVQFKKNF